MRGGLQKGVCGHRLQCLWEIKFVRKERGQLGTRAAVRAVAGPGVRTGAAVGMERQEGPHRTGGKGLRWLWQQGTLSLTDCMYSLQDLSSSQVTQGRTEPEREGSGPV